jgi:hypothetical protein
MKIDRGTIERVILEPISSRYRAVEVLQDRDLKALPVDIGRDAWDLVRLHAGGGIADLQLEFLIGGIMVSAANIFEAELALGSARSPFLFPAHVVTTAYGMHEGPLAPALAEVPNSGARNNLAVYPEGPLFEFSERRRLSELLDVLAPGRNAAIAHSIFADLARLPEESRGETDTNDK